LKKLPYQRRKEILEILKQNDYADLKHLSERFEVSYMTIHRDIEELQRIGAVFRVYGGAKINAVPNGKDRKLGTYSLPVSADLTIEERFNESREYKQIIAQKASTLVQDGDIIGMDPSTTTLHMCSYINNMNLTVFTSSLMVALQLSSSPSVKVILSGGRLRNPSLSLLSLGPQSGTLGVHMKMCFLSSKSISFKEGLTDLTFEEPETKRFMVQNSEKVYVMMDHTKIGKVANFHVLDYQDMTAIITDSAKEMTQEQLAILKEYQEKGVDIIFADGEYSDLSGRGE